MADQHVHDDAPARAATIGSSRHGARLGFKKRIARTPAIRSLACAALAVVVGGEVTGCGSATLRECEPAGCTTDAGMQSSADANHFSTTADADTIAADARMDMQNDAAVAGCVGTFCLQWPMGGTDGVDWVINNYVDLEPGPGLRDYAGGIAEMAKTYNNHRGVDIDAPTFRSMDNNVPILAVADGEVIAVSDGNFDRNTTCSGTWNAVTIRHTNGYESTYGHLKKNSVRVRVNEQVSAGDPIAAVGSSGCSTAAHLHFELHNAQGVVVDPFKEQLWQAPPSYDTPIRIMDLVVRLGGINSIDDVKDPPENARTAVPLMQIGFGLSVAGGKPSDSVGIVIRRPNGTEYSAPSVTFDKVHRHTYWYWNRLVENTTGTWTIDVVANGTVVRSEPFVVHTAAARPRLAQIHIPARDLQATFDAFTDAGYRPIHVDGYNIGDRTFFNQVFVYQASNPAWVQRTNQSAAGLAANQASQLAASRRMSHLDTYLLNGRLVYASIWTAGVSDTSQAVALNVSSAELQTRFNNIVNAQGHITRVTATLHNGELRYTMLYDTINRGAWYQWTGMTAAGYVTRQADMVDNKGVYPQQIHVTPGPTQQPSYQGLWWGTTSQWDVCHACTRTELDMRILANETAGIGLRSVVGYEHGGNVRFAALWRR